MENVKKSFFRESGFVVSLITIITLLNLYVFAIDGSNSWISLVASITGVFCVVLTAKGNIWCYAFGIVNIITYIIIAIQANYQGEVILNGLYYFPMQFYGILVWKKNLKKESNIVKSKTMDIKQLGVLLLTSIIGIIAFMFFLKSRDSNLPLMDSTTAILSIVAMFLSVKMFTEQWILWIIINIISIIMWTIPALKGEPNSLAMVIMWSAYLLNAIYGYIEWKRNAVNDNGDLS